jgi:phosphate transport system permease protein
VVLGLLFVAILFLDIVAKGYTAFQQTYIHVPIHFDAATIDPEGTGSGTLRCSPVRTTRGW